MIVDNKEVQGTLSWYNLQDSAARKFNSSLDSSRSNNQKRISPAAMIRQTQSISDVRQKQNSWFSKEKKTGSAASLKVKDEIISRSTSKDLSINSSEYEMRRPRSVSSVDDLEIDDVVTMHERTNSRMNDAGMAWQFRRHDHVKEVDIYSKTLKSGLIAFKGTGVVAAPAEDIFQLVSGVDATSKWDKAFVAGELIQRIDHDNDILHIVYTSGMPLLVNDRDFCIRETRKRLSCGTLVVKGRSVEHPMCPRISGIVRGELLSSLWRISPMDDQEKIACTVTYEATVNLRGWVPRWLCNKIMADFPLAIHAVRTAAAAAASVSMSSVESLQEHRGSLNHTKQGNTIANGIHDVTYLESSTLSTTDCLHSELSSSMRTSVDDHEPAAIMPLDSRSLLRSSLTQRRYSSTTTTTYLQQCFDTSSKVVLNRRHSSDCSSLNVPPRHVYRYQQRQLLDRLSLLEEEDRERAHIAAKIADWTIHMERTVENEEPRLLPLRHHHPMLNDYLLSQQFIADDVCNRNIPDKNLKSSNYSGHHATAWGLPASVREYNGNFKDSTIYADKANQYVSPPTHLWPRDFENVTTNDPKKGNSGNSKLLQQYGTMEKNQNFNPMPMLSEDVVR